MGLQFQSEVKELRIETNRIFWALTRMLHINGLQKTQHSVVHNDPCKETQCLKTNFVPVLYIYMMDLVKIKQLSYESAVLLHALFCIWVDI